MSVVVSVIFGFILLVAITFAIPSQTGVQAAVHRTSRPTSGRPRWARTGPRSCSSSSCCAQFYCLTACITSGSRMLFAFSRDGAVPGPPALALGLDATASRSTRRRRRRRRSRSCCLLPTWWNNLAGYYVGTSVGTTGLYIAFILPVFLRSGRATSFERGAWSLGRHYKWINVDRDHLGRLHLDPLHAPDRRRRRSRGTRASPGTPSTTRRSPFVGAFLLFGGWWVLSAKQVVQGPGPAWATEASSSSSRRRQEGTRSCCRRTPSSAAPELARARGVQRAPLAPPRLGGDSNLERMC